MTDYRYQRKSAVPVQTSQRNVHPFKGTLFTMASNWKALGCKLVLTSFLQELMLLEETRKRQSTFLWLGHL